MRLQGGSLPRAGGVAIPSLAQAPQVLGLGPGSLPPLGIAQSSSLGDDTVWSASATTTPVHGVALNRADS